MVRIADLIKPQPEADRVFESRDDPQTVKKRRPAAFDPDARRLYLSSLPPSAHMSAEEAAIYLGVSVHTLDKYRGEQGRPPCRYFGRRVVYNKGELDQWAAQQPTERINDLPPARQ